MARPKKPTYEWVASRKQYRKRIKDVDGKYVALYAATPDELTIKVQEAQQQIDDALFRKGNPTVKEYAERWLEMRATHIRSNTLADYRSKVKNYLIKPLGDYRLSELTPDDIEAAIAPAARKSSSVYRTVHMLYKAIFGSARKSHLIADSPCEDLNPKGGKAAREKEALTDQQAGTLLDAVRGLDVYPFVMIALYTGLRREEILGLQWDCVHLSAAAPHLDVRRAWRIEHNRPIVSTELKSKAAYRTIPLPSQLVRCLRSVPRTSDYIISRTGGPLTGSQWGRLWAQVTKRTTKERSYTRYKNGHKEVHIVRPKLGESAPHNPDCIYSIDFEVTPHILRHTYITNLILGGVDVRRVQYLAGHENPIITLRIYTHLMYNRPEDNLDIINDAFKNGPS